LTRAIAATLFNGAQSVGILFHEYFEEMPLPAVAFVLTNVGIPVNDDLLHAMLLTQKITAGTVLYQRVEPRVFQAK
jgi:hypothetical protein